MNELKYFFVLTSLGNGGAERVSETLAYYHAKRGLQVKVINLSSEGKLRRTHKNLSLVCIGGKRFRNSVIKMAHELIREKPNVVFSSFSHISYSLLILRFLKVYNSRLILRESSTVEAKRKNMSNLLLWVEKISYVFLTRKDDYLIFQNNRLLNEFNDTYLTKAKTLAINNPIDPNYLICQSRKYHVQRINNNINLLAVGNLKVVKRYDILVDSIVRLIKLNSSVNLSLKIVGSGTEKEYLENLIESNKLAGKVEIVNFSINPYPYYEWADIFVLSSENEASPNVLLEAMTFNLPIVSTDCYTGPRDIMGENYPYLVSVNDSNAIATAINTIINTNMHFHYDLSKYHVDNIVEKYLDLLG